MFDISWGEFLVLIVAGLFILGPERLPGAAAWLGRTVRQMRQYATGAQQQLQKELGPEFDELRKPLQDLQQLRNFDPKRAVTRTLMDATGGYDPREDLRFDDLKLGTVLGKDNDVKPNGYPLPERPVPQRPLAPGERPPFDPDAT
jgi:sec-independent protein translocase protein TatB